MPWHVTVRTTGRVDRLTAGDFGEALDILEREARASAATPDRREVTSPLGRVYEPVQRVMTRVELSGPGRVRGGVDVRGDGSAEAFTGRMRRRVVEQRERESPYAALRRALSGRVRVDP